MEEIEEQVNKTVRCLKEVPGPASEGCTEKKEAHLLLQDCEIRQTITWIFQESMCTSVGFYVQ